MNVQSTTQTLTQYVKLPQYLEERKAMLEVGSEGTFLTRLQAELAEMTQRTLKLSQFIDTPPFFQLSGEDRRDLEIQLGHMQNYVSILTTRLNRLHKAH